MSDTTNLDGFLGRNAEPPPPEPEAPAPEAAAPEPEAPEAPPEGEPPAPAKDARTVPLAALESERRARQDHKAEAARLSGELAELRRQMEESKRAPPPPPPDAPQFIDPRENPDAFIARTQQVMVSNKLDVSEMMLRSAIGAEAVDSVIAEFKEAAAANPSLYQQLYSQPHPYDWAHKHVETLRLQRDIGSDRAGYEARLREKWEAERNGDAPPPVSPAAGRAPSLAGVRSAAPRSAPAFSGPTPMGDVLRK